MKLSRYKLKKLIQQEVRKLVDEDAIFPSPRLGEPHYIDDEAMDDAFGTAVTATADAGSGSVNDLHITAASAAMTVAGSPAEGKLVMFQIYRDVSADDYNAEAHLLGVNIQYRESATASGAW